MARGKVEIYGKNTSKLPLHGKKEKEALNTMLSRVYSLMERLHFVGQDVQVITEHLAG